MVKIIFNNKNYNIDESALAPTMAALEAHLRSMAGGADPVMLAAGLYQTGAIALYEEQGAEAIEGMLITPWDELVASGAIAVDNGAVSVGSVLPDNLPEKNEYGFYYGVQYGQGFGLVFYEDGSVEIFDGGKLAQAMPAGSAVYSTNQIDSAFGTFQVSLDGKRLVHAEIGGLQLGSRVQVAGDLIIPNDDSVTAIGQRGFLDQMSLTGITIPDCLLSIDSMAFYNCTGLTDIDFGANSQLVSIGVDAINGCLKLTEIEIPASTTSFARDAFSGCELNKVYYKGTLEKWCNISFKNFASNPCNAGADLYIDGELANYIVIPSTVTKVNDNAFAGCTSLTGVNIQAGATSIGVNAFWSCSNLTSVEIPDTVTTINNRAFSYCPNLSNVSFGANSQLTNIGENAFRECTSLTNIVIPNGVLLINNDAFYKCTGLTSIEIPYSVKSIGERAFEYCSGLTSVVIGNGVTSIGKQAFQVCTSLNSITFEGTTAQWNAISKGSSWKGGGVPATYVQCSDGQVAL